MGLLNFLLLGALASSRHNHHNGKSHSSSTYSSYDRGYSDGYDNGYEDCCMDHDSDCGYSDDNEEYRLEYGCHDDYDCVCDCDCDCDGSW